MENLLMHMANFRAKRELMRQKISVQENNVVDIMVKKYKEIFLNDDLIVDGKKSRADVSKIEAKQNELKMQFSLEWEKISNEERKTIANILLKENFLPETVGKVLEIFDGEILSLF